MIYANSVLKVNKLRGTIRSDADSPKTVYFDNFGYWKIIRKVLSNNGTKNKSTVYIF